MGSAPNVKLCAYPLNPPCPHSVKQCIGRGWGISIEILVSVPQTDNKCFKRSWCYTEPIFKTINLQKSNLAKCSTGYLSEIDFLTFFKYFHSISVHGTVHSSQEKDVLRCASALHCQTHKPDVEIGSFKKAATSLPKGDCNASFRDGS